MTASLACSEDGCRERRILLPFVSKLSRHAIRPLTDASAVHRLQKSQLSHTPFDLLSKIGWRNHSGFHSFLFQPMPVCETVEDVPFNTADAWEQAHDGHSACCCCCSRTVTATLPHQPSKETCKGLVFGLSIWSGRTSTIAVGRLFALPIT